MNGRTLKHSSARHAEAAITSVIALEKQVWKAAQQRDLVGFKRLVPADAVMIFQSGIVHQPDYVATMLERTISHYELRNMRGFMPAPETVILIYEATRAGSFRGKSFPPGSVIESTTWVLRDGCWVSVLNQETPIAGEK
ncbi:MAG TPA: DUF4440 domain-containing protein [Terriglobales bacterium]|nr:DUF4440 domain-containing protein [Terriglobales bacterium]